MGTIYFGTKKSCNIFNLQTQINNRFENLPESPDSHPFDNSLHLLKNINFCSQNWEAGSYPNNCRSVTPAESIGCFCDLQIYIDVSVVVPYNHSIQNALLEMLVLVQCSVLLQNHTHQWKQGHCQNNDVYRICIKIEDEMGVRIVSSQ